MDVRLSLGCLGLSVAMLVSGCSPDDAPHPMSLEQKTAQFEKTLDTIQDPQLKDAVTDLGSSLLLLERAQLKLEDKPVETDHTNDELALLKHYPSPQALAQTYIDGLFVLRKNSGSDYLTDLEPVFPFNANDPGEFPFPHALEWQSVILSNKQVVPFQPEWSETDPSIQLSPSSASQSDPDDLTITYPYVDTLDLASDKQAQPVRLQGKVEVVAPRKVFTFELNQKDIGQTRTDENIRIKLLSMNRNYAEVELSNSAPLAPQVRDITLNPLIIQAKDSTGQFLSRAGVITQSAEQQAFHKGQLEQMLKQKTWSDAFAKQLQEQQHSFEEKQNRHYAKVYFNGLPQTLEVSVLDFSSATLDRKELDLPVHLFQGTTLGKTIQPLPLSVVIYDDQAANWLKGASLDEEQLKKSVTITQGADDASAARIEFEHPQTFNDELLGNALNPGPSPVTFFAEKENGKRGAPLDLPPEAVEVDPQTGVITYDLSLFPETPAFAIGSIPLFLATIEKKSFTATALPEGLEIRDNALIVEQKRFPADAWRFYAKDASGNYLKQALSVSHSATANGPAVFDVHYFYGHPTSLEAYQRTELNTVEYGFDIKLDKAAVAGSAQ